MSLGKLLFGYYLGKSSEKRKEKRRKKARMLFKGFKAVFLAFIAVALGFASILKSIKN
ncbi:MAG: hypothetical protein ABEJ75_02590 [Candidatus Nanohaloarchaea archaeon]